MTARRTARRRMTAAALLALTLGCLALVLPGSASAVPGPAVPAAAGSQRSAIVDCIPGLDGTSPPQSMAPSEVAGSFFDPASAKSPTGTGQTSSLPANNLSSYGWAGFSWPDYEPGCSATISLDDRLTGTLARASLATLVWANAATTGASRYAYDPATYDPINTLAQSLDSGIGDGFARPGFWIVALLLGAALVWTADRRSPRHHARTATLVLALGLSVVTVGTWNATLGPTVDRAVLTVVSWANSAATPGPAAGATPDAGQQIGESLRSNIVLRTWRSGVFGPNSATADQYTDPLLAAGAISNAEAAAAGTDSDRLGELAETDKKTYEQLAGQIKSGDERAYDYLAGRHNGTRLFYATLGWLTWLWAASFQTVAAFATAYALTLVRLVLGLWSAIALVGLFRPRYALRALGMLVGALVAGIGLSVIAAGARLAYGQLLATATAMSTWVTVGVGLVVCAATWAIAWPLFRVLPGAPERLRRIGRRVHSGDDGSVDGADEPATTSGVGAAARGLGGPGEAGVPAEADPGRPAIGILAAAAEGTSGRRTVRRTAGGLALGGAIGGTLTSLTSGGSEPTSTGQLNGVGNGVVGNGVVGNGTVNGVAAGAAAGAAAAQVGAEARPTGRHATYALGAESAPRRASVPPAPPRPPRKDVPSLYPLYATPDAPSAPDLLNPRADRTGAVGPRGQDAAEPR